MKGTNIHYILFHIAVAIPRQPILHVLYKSRSFYIAYVTHHTGIDRNYHLNQVKDYLQCRK